MLILSEQYHNRDSPGWFHDNLGRTAVWIPDLRNFQILAHGSGRGFVWVRSERFTVGSCYLTPNDPIAEFQTKLDAVENFLVVSGGNFIVTGTSTPEQLNGA